MRFLTTIFILLLLAPVAANGIDVPKFQGFINDYGEMISPAARASIEEQLKALEQSDSTQIFILTVPTLEEGTIEDFAIKVFDIWKAGQKGLDNGVIMIVAKKERKIRIEVGRGLEGKLTDLAAGRIIDNVIKPRFKEGNFEGGFVDGVAALVQATKGEFKASGQPRKQGNVVSLRADRLCIFLIGVVVMIVIIAKLSRRNRGKNFKRMGKAERKLIMDKEWTSGWATAAGIGLITFPLLALLSRPAGDGMSFLSFAMLSLGGMATGLFTKVISQGAGTGTGVGGGVGSSSGGGWSSSGSSYSSSDSSSGGGDSSSGGGGDSGGGGASGDY